MQTIKSLISITISISIIYQCKQEPENDVREYSQQTQDTKFCRICYDEAQSDSEDGSFVDICKCKGQIENIHLGCLRKWIQQKSTIKEEGFITNYRLYQFECELCKEPYPLQYYKNGKKVTIFDIPRPEGPYLILEQKDSDKNNSSGPTGYVNIYVVNFGIQQQQQPDNNNVVKLGRGHGCDIRISDISVSRLHAMIRFQDNDFLLIDNNSKFGSLVLIQKPYQLKQERIAIQVGRTVITLFLKVVNTNQGLKYFDKKLIEKGLLGTKEEFDKQGKVKMFKEIKLDKENKD